MPLAFPAHQGLIAPLWRKWPDRFNVLALWVGAAIPDGVDGIIGAFRGHLGQDYGHSLIGLFVFCLPLGLVATWGIGALGEWLGGSPVPAATSTRWTVRLGQNIQSLNAPNSHGDRWTRMRLACLSVWIGAFSHLFFDFFSHGRFMWLYPWYNPHRFFPEWWYFRWFEIPLPGYEDPYPMGPHLLVWIGLNIIGITAFILALRRKPGATPHRTDGWPPMHGDGS